MVQFYNRNRQHSGDNFSIVCDCRWITKHYNQTLWMFGCCRHVETLQLNSMDVWMLSTCRNITIDLYGCLDVINMYKLYNQTIHVQTCYTLQTWNNLPYRIMWWPIKHKEISQWHFILCMLYRMFDIKETQWSCPNYQPIKQNRQYHWLIEKSFWHNPTWNVVRGYPGNSRNR